MPSETGMSWFLQSVLRRHKLASVCRGPIKTLIDVACASISVGLNAGEVVVYFTFRTPVCRRLASSHFVPLLRMSVTCLPSQQALSLAYSRV